VPRIVAAGIGATAAGGSGFLLRLHHLHGRADQC